MYDIPVRGPRTRTGPNGDPANAGGTFLLLHRLEAAAAARGDRQTREAFAAGLFDRVTDLRNLRAAYAHVAAAGGEAPGADGLRLADVDPAAGWEMLRVIRATLLDDTYRPGPVRRKRVAKASGRGHRTLSIPTLVDRFAQRAFVQVVQPFVDPRFDPNSFGYRPGRTRGRLFALARAGRYVAAGRGCVVAEDFADAYDNVPRRRLLDVVPRYLPDERLMRFAERLILAPSGSGLLQGTPASSLFLNIYLDHHLDRVWRRRRSDVALVRVADDLLLLCQDVAEAKDAYGLLEAITRPTGMRLKGTQVDSIRDLVAGQSVDWLGFRATAGDGGLAFDIADRSWTNLGTKLALAHKKPNSPLVARMVIDGWVTQQGPAYAPGKAAATYARVAATAEELAFAEIPHADAFHSAWKTAHTKWETARGVEAADPLPHGDAAKEEGGDMTETARR